MHGNARGRTHGRESESESESARARTAARDDDAEDARVPLLREATLGRGEADVDAAMDAMRCTRVHGAVLAMCACAYAAVCSELLVLVFALAALQREFAVADADAAWLLFASAASSSLAGFACAWLSDRVGRRGPLLAACITATLGSAVCAAAPSFAWLVAMRVVAGAGVGGIAAIVFVSLSETVPRRWRARAAVAVTACGALGVLFVAVLAWLALPLTGWRVFVALCALPCASACALRLALWRIESPYTLLAHGRSDDAVAVLLRLGWHPTAALSAAADVLAQLPPDETLRVHEALRSAKDPPARHALDALVARGQWRVTVPLCAAWFCLALGYWGLTLFLPAYFASISVDAAQTLFYMVAAELPGLAAAMLVIGRWHVRRSVLVAVFAAVGAAALAAQAAVVGADALSTSIPPAVVALSVLVYAAVVPIWALLYALTPALFGASVRGRAQGVASVVSSLPSLAAPFVSATLAGGASSVPRWVYPCVWAVVFAGCAASGALVAAAEPRAPSGE